MDIFEIKDKQQGVIDLLEDKQVKRYKDTIFFCSKRCLDLKSSTLSPSEKTCFNHCSTKYLQTLSQFQRWFFYMLIL